VVELVLAAGLLLVAARTWRGRPAAGVVPQLPGWMRTIDTFTTGRSLAMGVALSAINPKNLVMAIAAGAAIAQTGIRAGQQAIALAVFVLLATLGPALPLMIAFATGDRSEHVLGALRDWMARHNAAIMTVVLLVIAAKLIGDAIAAL
jgi:threonine/homoserine/homoserine lactone efflux protein